MATQRYTQPADFWQERDFGGKISAAFEFIGAHWRPLGKCLVYFVLPLTLLGGIGLGLLTNKFYTYAYMNEAARRAGSYGNYSPADALSIGGGVLAGISLLLASVMLSATVYGYVRVRLQLPAGEVVQPRQVWQAVRSRLLRVVLGVLALGVLTVLAFAAVVVALVFGVKSLALGVAGNIGIVFLLVLVLTIPIAYVSVTMGLYFPVLWLEDRGVFAAVGRCFQLIRGHWWATALLTFVASLLQSMLGFVFVLPQYAVIFGKALKIPYLDSDILGVLAQCIYAVGIILTYVFPLLTITFQYFSLVENREATGALMLLGQLGQVPATQPVISADYYRPDEEGEY